MKTLLNTVALYLVVLLTFLTAACSQIQTPLEKSNFTELSNNKDMCSFLDEVSANKGELKTAIIGRTTEGRDIPAVFVSTDEYGTDTSKVKVLLFAQQHGNEQSGKEGALFLIKEIAEGKLDYLLDKIDLLIVPQVNPDGADADKRRNGMDLDLNRNHLILTAPETAALHKLFDLYLPEVTMDVHEYYPYSESWTNFGAIKNFDEQFGSLTNPNTSQAIREFSKKSFLPFIQKYMNERDFTFQEYIIGGPPTVERIRHSTFDINDGRQSFGSFGSFSLIMEGKNGVESIDGIARRAEGQCAGMKGLLQFVYENSEAIKKMVADERSKLINGESDDPVAIQMEHIANGDELSLTLLSTQTNKDTVVTVKDYRPVVNSLYDVKKPLGYLIPKNDMVLAAWTKRHNLKSADIEKEEDYKLIQYFITGIDSIDFEGDIVINPSLEERNVNEKINLSEYLFLPTRQLKGTFITQALEPKSMIGLATYKGYEYLVRQNELYPILRVGK
ncbi:MAG: hypothetical protein KKA84_04440 [Bacteroidetes bacterium]|nr:hypothetical protein [Bacteroidota bacterium]